MKSKVGRRAASVGIACVGALMVSAVAAADTGDLDPSWGGDGIVGVASQYEVALAPLDSGRLFATAYRDVDGGRMRVTRFEANGTPSTAMGGSGTVLRSFSPSTTPSVSYPAMLRLTRLNKPVIIGEYYTGTDRLGVARLTTTGAYDTSFSGDGRVHYRVFSRNMDSVFPFSGTVLPNGKTMIGVAGFDDIGFAQSVVRLNSNGTLDTSFSGDGKHALPLSDGDVEPAANGAMFINTPQAGGWVERIRKVNASATGLDTTFSGDGRLDINCTEHVAMDLDLDDEGRLLAVCVKDLGTSAEFRLFRFTPTGAPDLTFSGDGKLSRTIPIDAESRVAVAYSDAGEVWLITDDTADASVVRSYKLTESGDPDPLWNGDGEASTSLGFAMALDHVAFGANRFFVSAHKNAGFTAIAALEADPAAAEAMAPAVASTPKSTGAAPSVSARDTKLGVTLR